MRAGLVRSHPQPGANITGVVTASGALTSKRLELLKYKAADGTTDLYGLYLSADGTRSALSSDTAGGHRRLRTASAPDTAHR